MFVKHKTVSKLTALVISAQKMSFTIVKYVFFHLVIVASKNLSYGPCWCTFANFSTLDEERRLFDK